MSNTRKLVYISGPITRGKEIIDQSAVDDALEMARQVLMLGHTPYCPHYRADFFQKSQLTWDQFIEADLEAVSRCDAIYLHEDWDSSPGCVREFKKAKECGLAVLGNYEQLQQFAIDPPVKTEYVRSIDLMDDTMREFLHQRILPKMQLGSIEHGNGTWKGKSADYMAKFFISEEHMDLAFYHLFLSYSLDKSYDMRYDGEVKK